MPLPLTSARSNWSSSIYDKRPPVTAGGCYSPIFTIPCLHLSTKVMRYVVIVTALFLTTHLQAQVPGFMGKRWAIFLEANPTPAVLVMNSNNEVAVNPGGDDAR